MKIKLYSTIVAAFLCTVSFSQTLGEEILEEIELDEIIITSSKETNELDELPGSVSLITPQIISERKITSVVDLSSVIPNFFIPAYGSKMSTPVFIRGIGERSSGQAVGLYVDNMPYLDKSVFNFNFLDVQRIEVLRGPQGTLYGRNAMSGIVNVFTRSPLEYDRDEVTLTAGNYGLFRASATVSGKIGRRAGLSTSGYFDRNSGFFENRHSGKSADRMSAGGGRIRLDVRPTEKWTLQLFAGYDHSDQGAFPYGEYLSVSNIEAPDYDHEGHYRRETASGNINAEYKSEKIIFTSSTGFQYLGDDMNMDLDYSPQSVFTINQRQSERNLTQEFAIRSASEGNYRWSAGAFGFSRGMGTRVLTTMKQGAISGVLQPVFDGISAGNPRAPRFSITDSEILIPGMFKTPALGAAVFHQSTFNNFIIDNLSVTAGIRFDYEHTILDYSTSAAMNINVIMPNNVVIPNPVSTDPAGAGSMQFREWLPKLAVKYSFNNDNYVYASVAKGYKAGGYNIQMFADIVRGIMMEKGMNRLTESPKELPDSILAMTAYRPEYSWNLEAGYKGVIIKNRLLAEIAVFYADVRDVLITQFVSSGQGRMLKNAGRAASAGFDISLTAFLLDGLTLYADYGYTSATFRDYRTNTKDGDYTGNAIPFAPQNTFSLATGYTHRWNKDYQNVIRGFQFFNRFSIHAQYSGAGKIYWTEDNTVSQPFYGLLNMKAGVGNGVISLDLWAKNMLNTSYAAFYFETDGLNLAQRGVPFQMGIDLTVSF